MRGWKVIAMAAVCGGLVAGAVGYAAIPAADGTISACKNREGGIKLIDREAGQACLESQELVEWNKQGPAGPAGPQGPASLTTRRVQVNSDAVESTFDGFDYKVAAAVCGPGEFVTGGGFTLVNGATTALSQVRVKESLPTQPVLGYPPDGPPNTWFVGAIAPSGVGPWTIGAFAVCATPVSVGPLP